MDLRGHEKEDKMGRTPSQIWVQKEETSPMSQQHKKPNSLVAAINSFVRKPFVRNREKYSGSSPKETIYILCKQKK